MKIGFYNPYLDALGGGERYTLALACHWSKTHDVHIFWDDPAIVAAAKDRFAIDVTNLSVVPNVFRQSILSKLLTTKSYDLLFVLSDGSVPWTLARHNILHFQVPFAKVSVPSLKLSCYQNIICNSQFTKLHVNPIIGSLATVIYPPVNTKEIKSGKKEHIILSVGRFTNYFHAKKQDVLISAFKKLSKLSQFRDWKLVLIGGMQSSDEEYFRELEHCSEGYRIELFPNVSHTTLLDFYQKATLYWHAAGFGAGNPELMEHFGISTVEAMAGGCIPLVFAGGGLPEIVENGASGYIWKSIDELLAKTQEVVKDVGLLNNIRICALARSQVFDEGVFFGAFDALLKAYIR